MYTSSARLGDWVVLVKAHREHSLNKAADAAAVKLEGGGKQLRLPLSQCGEFESVIQRKQQAEDMKVAPWLTPQTDGLTERSKRRRP